MKDLIEALQIFAKYTDSKYPISCEHDVMYVFVSPEDVSEGDITALQKLGFEADRDLGSFYSYKWFSLYY